MNNIEQKKIYNYWRRKLGGTPVITNDFSKSICIEKTLIKDEDLSYFNQITGRNKLAEHSILIIIFNILLQRYFASNELIFSLGMDENKAPLLYKFSAIKGKTLKQYIQESKKEIQDVYTNGNYAEEVKENYSFEQYTPYAFCYRTTLESSSSFPFCLNINKNDNELIISLSYSEKFIDKHVSSHFIQSIKRWLINLKSYINNDVNTISILSEKERHLLVHTDNGTSTNFNSDETIVSLFEKQAAETPNQIAAVYKSSTLTYKELNDTANQFANYLRVEYDIAAGDFVAVKLERTEKLLITLLGILKAGAAYIPIDINYPKERIKYIENHSKSSLVITAKKLKLFYKDQYKYSKENSQVRMDGSHTAYVIYTSGTTGKPKGVVITHKNVAALIFWACKEFDSSKFEVVYAATSHCFDLSVFEMFYTLSIGKKVKILTNALDIESALKNDEKVLLNTVPSSIRTIINNENSLKNVTVINLAGEIFPVEIAKKLLETNAEVRNLYGPSEDTTYSTCYKLSSLKKYTFIPIGKPIAHTEAYILDDELQLVPVGVVGKLYLAGEGVAKGYLNNAELTQEKFIENPFNKGQRMYDTGDLATWMPNGILKFLGRKDDQIKLRGYRIELGEIENEIFSSSENILQASVILKGDILIGYYLENRPINKTHLFSYIEKRLPSYMIPNQLIKVDEIPLTPNGKVDKNKLSQVKNLDDKAKYIAPSSQIEKEVVKIWESVLGISPIGINDHFFELGGHSLMVSQVINLTYKNLNQRITHKTFFKNPTIKDFAKELKSQEYTSIPKTVLKDGYPLTPSQHRLWLLSQFEGGGIAYQISGALRLKSKINQPNFVNAFKQVFARHEILRTVFKADAEGVIKQYVIPEDAFKFELKTIDFSNKKRPEKSVKAYIQKQDKKAFNLTTPPLFKIALLKIDENSFVFYLAMHHIISDGWSLNVLTNEIVTSYNSLQNKEEVINLPQLSIQYKDYAVWLSNNLNSPSHTEAEKYWHKNFSESIPILNLPTYQPRPQVKTYAGKIIQHDFSKKLIKKIKHVSQEQQATLFMTLMSCVRMLLSRYSNQTDISIGTPVAGRSHPDLEPQIGLYINTLAIRTKFNTDDRFSTLLAKEKEQLQAAYTHQDFPFDKLVENLAVSRDTSRSPLFDVMVVLQNQQERSSFYNEGELVISDFETVRETAQFDLTFSFVENDSLSLLLSYNTDLYSDLFIKRMTRHLEKIFEQITSSQEIKLNELTLITKEEKNQLFTEFNATTELFPLEKTVIDLFYEQVRKNPKNIAVNFENETLTYAALDEKSSRLSVFIQQKYAVTNGTLVGILLERSTDLIISILAVLKAGAAYVPIDLKYPEERINYIKKDAGISVCIDETFLATFRKKDSNVKPLKLDSSPHSDDVAYVIYTSGSTGNPKGVVVKHKSLTNLCFWHQKAYHVSAESKGTLFSGIGFDASVWEIYPYLTVGASLVPIQSDAIRFDVEALSAFLKNHQITHAYLPSKICQDFIAKDISDLETIIVTGGEALTYSKKTNLKIYNNYGPTENTVVTTFFDCTSISKENIPIGKPISNTKVYILTETLQLTPIGVVGELCISGTGLATEYLNRPTLTTEKFVENPYRAGERLYKTGDLARWLPDGNIEFIGRKDTQIKIRGNRVELGEIEASILKFNAEISHAIVSVKTVNSHEVLVAYYLTSESIDIEELRNYLSGRLPIYMVPNYYSKLEKVPLTSNGKIDRDKLPVISELDIVKKQYIVPNSKIEIEISTIWKAILGIQKIGVLDDFFELGGHSLLLTKLLNEYQKTFKVAITLEQLYTNTTLRSHAKLLNNTRHQGYKIEKAPLQEYYNLSSSQMRYWLLYKIQGKSKIFNIYSALQLPENVDTTIMEESFNELMKRHEILRTVFIEDKGVPKQHVQHPSPVEILYCNTKEEAVDKVFNHEFDLDTYPLFKIAIVQEAQTNTLFFNIHHSISDGWSMKIIHRDLMELYDSAISARKPKLCKLSIQYKDYAQWQHSSLQLPEMITHENYWKNHLKGDLPYLQLPTDYATKLKTTQKNASFHKVYISEEQKQKIETLAGLEKVSAFAFFVATLKIVLHRLTSEEDIIIGIPVANRNHFQLKDSVGCFINTLMLRDVITDKGSFKEWLQSVSATLTSALMHQEYPFEMLLNQLNYSKEEHSFPISPVFLNMIDFESESSEAIRDFSASHGVLESSPKFDLECYIKSYENGYALNFVYDNTLFKKETIAYWAEAYMCVMDQVVNNFKQPIQNIKLFENNLYNQTDLKPTHEFVKYERDEIQQCITERFEKQVKQFPNDIAIFSDGNEITYKSLNNHANHLANQIHNVTKDTNKRRVALFLNHDESSVIGMLGTLKAGYSYVPIDVGTPIKRVKYIIEDADCMSIVCTKETAKKAQEVLEEVSGVALIQLSENDNLEEIPNPTGNSNVLNEAYVLYTSGSSGMPKGVMQNHRNVLHYISVYTNNIRITQKDKLSVLSTYTFDASVKDIYAAILNGASVNFYNVSKKGINNLSSWLRTEHITVLHIIPTIYRYFLKEFNDKKMFKDIRLVDLGGEPCHKIDFDLFKTHFPKHAFLVNDYGPTESTIVSQKFLNHTSQIIKNNIPLGSAVIETEVFLLDENNCKKGVYQEGEIAFKSEYLSLGYLNKKELTEKAFITDPITGTGRIYKSGDIGKMLPTGEIEFLHRKDTQVKLNGLRIELSEIEYNLEQITNIAEAIVLIKNIEENPHIVAYLRTKEQIESSEIKELLSKTLPKYMIPNIFMVMEHFPHTRTGKIERKSFPTPTVSDLKKTPYIPPSTDLEKELITIWKGVLKTDNSAQIGIKDNFFELGGNSIQAVILINEINKIYNTSFSVVNLYDTLNIEDLAVLLNFAILQNKKTSAANQEQDEVIL
ncbi:amino acid adenylation domain-containing protein [Kordia sp. YSTF-M3]|uniref:Amino acid adenylation domain-containing protein n=1 Tax=Kordia aestuariivivens TaxID=2759037 RepID=A0ABR7QE64_9FLAO|nr:non-ribosomal peptide synthetase [Kordia aestuariivivens]MBC8756865.1 amino acid adenylation domain-containing protein [Kordia aestuariivivens]